MPARLEPEVLGMIDRRSTHRGRGAATAALAAAVGLALALSAAVAGASEPALAAATPARPRTALVLGGGGARGAAHVGVLKVMEELHVPVDFIVGTSMGSIVGGLYASGVAPEAMERQFVEIDWEDAFDDEPPRKYISFRRKEDGRLSLFKFEMGWGKDGFASPSGLVAGQKLNFLLRSMLIHASEPGSFDDLPIPYRAIAADLVSGDMVVLDSGDLARAIRASMAYPVVFTPVEIDDRILVDGGVVRNVPVDVAIEMGADRIIAIDVSTPLREIEKSGSALKVVQRTMSLMGKQNVREQRERVRAQDLLLTPELEGIGFLDFDKTTEAVARGERIARAHEDRLREFSVPEQEFAAFLARQRAGTAGDDFVVDRIDVRGVSRVAPRQILGRIETRPGEPVDLPVLGEDLQRVHEIGEFETVEFRLEHVGGHEHLIVDASEKPWGPWYFRIGATVEADFEGEGRFTGQALMRRAQFNDLGAEWRSLVTVGDRFGFDSDFFQPVTYSGRFFVRPRATYLRNGDRAVRVDDERILVDLDEWAAGFDVGAQFGNYGQISIGPEAGAAELGGLEGMSDIDADLGGLRLQVTLDVQDNAFFPRHGSYVRLDAYASREGLGADDEYERVELLATHAFGVGKAGTLLASVGGGTPLGSELPIYDPFSLGGWLNLSGLGRDELIGDRYAIARLAYYRRLGFESGLLGTPYIGGSLESGQAWLPDDDPSLSDFQLAGSLFVGTETVLGPFYFAYGLTESGQDKFYVLLGRVF
jgi:NTE family protein